MSFAVRLVTADFYSENPINGLDAIYSEFRGAQISKVPVIRIFGSTSAGQKTCLHVHGVFPYVYIPFDGTQPKDRYLFLLACSLDKAINISMGAADAGTRHVHNIELVNRIPFYGYHRKEHQFLKIYFYNPYIVKKAVELLQNGAVMGRNFQLYFAHIPYLLQMFIDYNLYGMNMVQLSKVKFRRKIIIGDGDNACPTACQYPSLNPSSDSGNLNVIWDPYNIPEHMLLDDAVVLKSTCCLEADCVATDIMNRGDLSGMKMNPGIAFIWEDERQRRRQNGLDSQMSLPSSQDRNYAVPTDSEEYFLQQLKKKLAELQSESLDVSCLTSQSHDSSGIEVEETGSQLSVKNVELSQDLEETVVDEEVALSLSLPSSTTGSQNTANLSLDSNDLELAGILQNLASTQSSGSSIWLTQQSQHAKTNKSDEENESDDETLMWTQEDLQTQVDPGCEDETFLATDDNAKSGLQDSWDWRNDKEVIPQLDGPGDVPPRPKRNINLSLSTKKNKLVSAEDSEPFRCKKIAAKHGVSQRNLNDDIEPTVDVAANNQVSSTTDPKKLQPVYKIGSLEVVVPRGVCARDLKVIGKEVLCIDKLREKGAVLVQNDKRCVKRDRCKVETEKPSMDGIAVTRSKRANVNYGPNQFTHLYDREDLRFPSTQAFCQDDVSSCKLFGCLYHSPSKAKVLLKRVDKELPVMKLLLPEDLPRRLSVPKANDDDMVYKSPENIEKKTDVINSQSLEDSVIEDEDCEVIQGTGSFVSTDNSNAKEVARSSRVPDKLEVPDYWAKKETAAEEFNDTLCKMSFIFPECDGKVDTSNRPSTVTSASLEGDGRISGSSLQDNEEQMVINESRSPSPVLQQCTPTRMQITQGFESFYEYSTVKPFSQTATLKGQTNDAIVGKTKILQYGPLPPSSTHIKKTMAEYGIPNARYKDAFFGCAKDVPVKALEVGGRILRLKSNLTADLPEFEGRFQNAGIENWKMILSIDGSDAMDSERTAVSTPKYSLFEPVRPPPSRKDVERWLMGTRKQVPVNCNNEKCDKKGDLSPKLQRIELPAIEISPIRTASQNQNQSSPVLDASFAALCSTPVNPRERINLSPSNASKLKRSFSDGEGTVNPDTKTKKSSLRLKTTKQRKLSFDDNLRRKTLVIQANKGRKDGSRGNSQIDGVTLNNTYGFKVSPHDIAGARATVECQGLTLMSIELHARTRENLCPDPRFDEIRAVFYHVKHDVPDSASGSSQKISGIIISDESKNNVKRNVLGRTGYVGANVTIVHNELELIQEFTRLVIEFDPDIILGYEIQMTSWGYLLERAEILGITLAPKISRIPDELKGSHLISDDDELVSQTCEIYIRGRIVLNVWRIMRSEVTLTSYTFENVVFHVLHQRTAKYPYQKLTHWFDHDTDLYRWKTIKYYALRAEGNILLLEKLDVVTRTSELAKLFGILFYDVLSRGSQFRVESMMHRLTTAANYITVSPSVLQRATMRAPECVQLILEPESRFYTHPVVVLDFQSLYPSMVIAYNYCYSTCLGRVEHHGKSEPFDFGCTTLKVPPALLKSLEGKIHYSPTGIAFVTSEVRRGILPQMLDEILSTRIMVKNALKAVKGDRGLEKLLDARQLGLKLIANVTYGYTSANFSGRMPCVEVGDSILGKARETLERAIRLVESTRKWDAKVVYGDTDSMFVHLPGRSREDAFRIGREMADAVTACNPWPVRLKFEKVYLPCLLQTKKRYVGFKYESESQTIPQFDAKGIETVRRDGCPAVVKVLEKSLHILFKTSDVSQVKAYVQKQFTKLLSGRASAQDYVFAREYRGMKTYKMGAHVAALEIAKRRLREDPRSEPRTGERVPYVIVYGSPGLPLIKLVREPQDLLKDPSLRLNAHYYVSNVICAPLQRNFSLIGADVNTWYTELPRVLRAPYMAAVTLAPGASISRYFTVDNCPVCNDPSGSGGNVCGSCRTKPQVVAIIVAERAQKAERKYSHHQMICKSCTGEVSATELVCSSLDCPVLFRFHQSKWDCAEVTRLRNLQW